MAKLQLSENLFDENKKLNEDFADSMPAWLRAHLLGNIINKKYPYSGPEKDKALDKYKNYNIKGLQGRRQYGKNLSGDTWNSDAIFRGLKNTGIDFSRANFIHGDPPTKSTDPRLKAPNQAFMLIEYDGAQQVYAPGLNDKDLTIFPIADNYAPANTYKYARFSDYKPYIKDFYYINTADPENHNDTLKSDRVNVNLGINDMKQQGQERLSKKELANFRPSWRSNARPDKSGYLVNPDRLKDALRKAQKNNYAKKLQSSYNRIQDAKDTLTNYIIESDAADRDSIRFATNIMRNELDDAVQYYNSFANVIQSAEREYAPTSNEFKRVLDNVFGSYGEAFYLDDTLDKLENAIASIKFVDFDW